MFKRLLLSSFSAVLRHPIDSGIQVCPPRDSNSRATPGGEEPLNIARQDFIDSVTDIRSQEAGDLLRRIRLARSLRELWFLRPEVFHLVAHHRDQSEANHRVAVLGAHFPRQEARNSAHRLRAFGS
jgi:hypothetical protein